ncbi:hypothetical protein KQX54_015563 [Cotesia glomerata]|uniref:Uncharacterized protein n=1 Tax=Cotesia glomerata TaxID=32391 RepID=A0AAV7IMV6_COTGL|nr:hypothetical protein KQX54_015563 [Cotesia glomerata]
MMSKSYKLLLVGSIGVLCILPIINGASLTSPVGKYHLFLRELEGNTLDQSRIVECYERFYDGSHDSRDYWGGKV